MRWSSITDPFEQIEIFNPDEMEQSRLHAQEIACQQLDEIAEEYRLQEEERKRVWGNKYPPILGMRHPDEKVAYDPVTGMLRHLDKKTRNGPKPKGRPKGAKDKHPRSRRTKIIVT